MKTEIDLETLRTVLGDIQYALDGLWQEPVEISADTGMDEDRAEQVLHSVWTLLSLDTKRLEVKP